LDHQGTRLPLRWRAQLDDAARRVAHGQGLRAATEATGYQGISWASLRIAGEMSPAGLEHAFATRFCAQLTDPAARDLGMYRHGDELWIVLVAPFATPALTDAAAVARSVLASVNEARARGASCGARVFAATGPVRLSSRLEQAARAHALDMAQRSYLDHIAPDGSTPAQRVRRTGYEWRLVGENIAAGPTSAAEVTRGWFASPAHCANVMDPRFTEMGVAYSVNPASAEGIYWTQVFAAPRER
jgi:uncharacterized protein YkwD